MALAGKYALVTGGSRGIGYEICRIFLENGARVLAVSRDLAKLAGAMESLPGLEVLQTDVSQAADVDKMAGWVRDNWGRLDVLINNAGVSLPKDGRLSIQPDDVFTRTLDINLIGPYLCTKRLLPALLDSDDPRIVNLGSTSGVMSPRLSGAYGVSKAALHALTIAQANDLRGRVAVNAMSPGWVRTDMAPNAPGDPRQSAETALWLVTQPREITEQFVRDKTVVGWAPLEIVEEVAAIRERSR